MKHEPFVSSAVIYKSGGGHPFPAGSIVPLLPGHATDLRMAGLEKKTEVKQAQPEKTPAPEKSAASDKKS